MDNINKWLTLAANIGVIAGIIFLGIELHQNNVLLEAQSRFNHKETRVDFSKYISGNSNLVDALLKSRKGELLTDHDLLQLDRLRDMIFTSWEWDYNESTKSNLEIPIEGYKSVLSEDRFLIEQWKISRTYYSREFVQFIDQLIRELE